MQGEQNIIDFLKVNLQKQNKRKYLQTVKENLIQSNITLPSHVLQKANQTQKRQNNHHENINKENTEEKPIQNKPQGQQHNQNQIQQQKPIDPISLILQTYQDHYRKFMYTDTLLSNAKSNFIIQDCLNAVNPGLKAKKDSKHILAIMSKIFIQELIEESLYVLEEYKEFNERIGKENVQFKENENRNGEVVMNGGNNGNTQMKEQNEEGKQRVTDNNINNRKKKQKLSEQFDSDIILQAYRRMKQQSTSSY